MKLFAAATLAGVLALGASSAQAATVMYHLTVNSPPACCGGTDYGTVTVTDITGGFNISVALASGVEVNANGNSTHDALAFDLSGSGITFGNFVSTLGTGASSEFAASGAIGNASPFGAFNNSVSFTGPNGNPSGVTSFSFDVTGTGLALGSTVFDGFNVVFVADVFANGLTGNVAAITGGIPEPASWGLMILGFGGIGAALRTRRQRMAIA